MGNLAHPKRLPGYECPKMNTLGHKGMLHCTYNAKKTERETIENLGQTARSNIPNVRRTEQLRVEWP